MTSMIGYIKILHFQLTQTMSVMWGQIQIWFTESEVSRLAIVLGRPTYMLAVDLCFTRDSFFFFLFVSSATRGARWTELNHIRSHGRK